MSDSTAHCWPEQNAVNLWWEAHSKELKEAVTRYRVAEQQKAAARIKELEEALGKAAQVAAREVRELQCGEAVEQAVFHAVKAVARAALAGEETKGG